MLWGGGGGRRDYLAGSTTTVDRSVLSSFCEMSRKVEK
jgi:hypothetical protein